MKEEDLSTKTTPNSTRLVVEKEGNLRHNEKGQCPERPLVVNGKDD